jgi:hypothetical protein
MIMVLNLMSRLKFIIKFNKTRGNGQKIFFGLFLKSCLKVLLKMFWRSLLGAFPSRSEPHLGIFCTVSRNTVFVLIRFSIEDATEKVLKKH